MIQLTYKEAEPIIKFNIEVSSEIKEIIIRAITNYINRIIRENNPDCLSWVGILPDNGWESFAITEINTDVVFVRKGSEIHVIEYTGRVIEKIENLRKVKITNKQVIE